MCVCSDKFINTRGEKVTVKNLRDYTRLTRIVFSVSVNWFETLTLTNTLRKKSNTCKTNVSFELSGCYKCGFCISVGVQVLPVVFVVFFKKNTVNIFVSQFCFFLRYNTKELWGEIRTHTFQTERSYNILYMFECIYLCEQPPPF